MPLKSLSEIRGNTNTAPSSSGGLVPLSIIRQRKAEPVILSEEQQLNDTQPADPVILSEEQMANEFPDMQPTPQAPPPLPQSTLPGRDIPVIGSVLKFADWISSNPISQAVSEYTVPDAPFLNEPDASNARETFLQSSNQEAATGASKFIGQITAPFFVPGADLGTGGGLRNAADMALEKIPGIGQGLGRAVAREAATGAPMGFGAEYAQGQGDLGQAAINGAAGAALGAAFPLLGKGVQSASNAARELMGQSPISNFSALVKQGGEYTHPMDTRSRIATKTKAEATPLESKLLKGYSNNFDDLQQINRFDKAVEEVSGGKLDPSERAYMQALNSRGSDMVSRHILTDSLVDSQGNVLGDSLKSVTSKLPKNKLIDFEDYLINKDAVGRMERGVKVFPDEMQMTPEKSAAKVTEYEAKQPEFKTLSDELYNFKNKMGKAWLVDTGILSPKQWDAFQASNPVHVPMRRLFSEIEKSSGNQAKRGFANQTNPIKKAVGSERKIISPVESIIEDVDRWVKTAKRNEVMQTVYKNLQKAPDEFKGWAEVIDHPEKMDDITDVNMDGEGIDEIVHRFNETFDKALKKPDLTKGNVLRLMVNGEPKYIKVHDPQFLESLTFLKPQAQNIVVNAARQTTRVMKLLTTGANPVFGLARNVFRDIPMAYVSSKTTSNPVKFGMDLLHGFVSSLGNGKLYRSFKAVGGGHSSSIAADRDLLAQSKRSILPQKLNAKTIGGKLLSGVENFNNALESAPRLGEFKRITKAGGNNYGSKIKGLYEANDVTVNFNRTGRYARDIDAFVPYFNAALQGLDKIGRIFKDNPVQATAKAVAAITIPQIITYAINHDNPEYQKLSNNIKDNFFLLPLEDGTFAKIAKPREAGMIFGTAVERALRLWQDKDPEAFKDFIESVKTNFLPPLIGGAISKEPLTGAMRDTIAGPAVDVGMNKNFVDSPIVPGYLQGTSPKYQYDQNTSELSKTVGDKLNYSPMKLDYLLKSYGGVIGQLGIPANAKGATVGETLKKQVTADPLYSNDIARNFYDKKEKLDIAQTDFKQHQEKSKEYDNSLRLQFNRVADQISDIQKKIRETEKNNTFTDEQKNVKIREYKQRINELAGKALEKVR